MKKIIVLVALLVTSVQLFCQNFNFKLSYGNVTDGRTYYYPYVSESFPGGSWTKKEEVPYIQLNAGYKLNKSLQTDVYIGYASLMLPMNPNDIYDTGSVSGFGLFYGAQLNYSVLPLFTPRNSRIDVYCIGKTGLVTNKWGGSGNNLYAKNTFEIGAGLGTAVFLTKKFGIFGEALFGKFYYSNFNWKAGLTFKL